MRDLAYRRQPNFTLQYNHSINKDRVKEAYSEVFGVKNGRIECQQIPACDGNDLRNFFAEEVDIDASRLRELGDLADGSAEKLSREAEEYIDLLEEMERELKGLQRHLELGGRGAEKVIEQLEDTWRERSNPELNRYFFQHEDYSDPVEEDLERLEKIYLSEE